MIPLPVGVAVAALLTIPAPQHHDPSPKPKPVVEPSAPPPPAPAPSPSTSVPAPGNYGVWQSVVDCEASGDWAFKSSGNGFYFALQFTEQTWLAYGGTLSELQAPNAPPPARLIQIAERVLQSQGPGAWPNCYP
jgi:hypothetical protein